MLSKVFYLLSLLALAYSNCVIMTKTLDGPPVNATDGDEIPQLYGQDWNGTIACPEFQHVPSCCNAMLNTIQANNFARLASAFGNSGAGCDVCAANLMRFFCYYSCSANQSDFMQYVTTEDITVEDSSDDLVTIPVAVVNLNMSADMACGVYQSCTKVSFMTEISAGASALGFLTFLFDRGITTSNTKDYVTIINQGGMNFSTPPHTCNQTFPNGLDENNYTIAGNCSCNYCSDSCQPLQLISYGGLTDGFKITNVILTYMFAVLLTVGCAFVKSYRKNRMNKRIQQNLLDSQEGSLSRPLTS